MKKLLSGKIVKAQGIRGEVKVYPCIDNLSGFSKIRSVIIDGAVIQIINARSAKDFVYLLLEGVTDRNAAEALRGLEVYVRDEDANLFKKGDYFVEEIIGLNAYVGEKLIGKVVDMYNNKAADIFVIEGEKRFMVPFLKKAIAEIDIDKSRLIFDSKIFKEIAYEY